MGNCINKLKETGLELLISLPAVGIIAGAAAGLALPIYGGYEAGDYIQKAGEFSPSLGLATKIGGAGALTYISAPITVPIGMGVGGIAGIAATLGAGYSVICARGIARKLSWKSRGEKV